MATLTVGLRSPRHQKATENIRRRAAGTSIAMCNACHLSVSQSARPVGSRDTGHRSNCRCTFSEPHSAQCRLHAVIGNNLHRAPLTPPSFYPAPNAGGNRVQPPRRAARRGRAGGLLRSRDDVEVGRETPGGGEGPCGGDHRAADVVGQAARGAAAAALRPSHHSHEGNDEDAPGWPAVATPARHVSPRPAGTTRLPSAIVPLPLPAPSDTSHTSACASAC